MEHEVRICIPPSIPQRKQKSVESHRLKEQKPKTTLTSLAKDMATKSGDTFSLSLTWNTKNHTQDPQPKSKAPSYSLTIKIAK